MYTSKKALSAFICAALAVTTSAVPAAAEEDKDLVIYYTNDVHCGISDNLGYASLSALKADALEKGNEVLLVDAGDSIQGAAIGALTKGDYIVDIMNTVGYDIAIPGNHEFDYGMDNFLSLAQKAEYKYICSNFIDTADNETVFEPYVIEEYDDLKIAFIGMITPATFASSTPAYFQNEAGEYIYSFCQGDNGNELYGNVQASIDSAKAEGADLVIGVSHLGIETSCSPWMSTEVIANTSGFDAVIDGHSHSTIEGDTVSDKEGNDVILTSTGTKLAAIGEMRITSDGEITTDLITEFEAADDTAAAKAFVDTKDHISEKTSEFDEILSEVVAHSDINLITVDPQTQIRLIRNGETNLGDLCADAYRTVMGADIGFANGGGIRADISSGDITYGDIIAVHPFGNMICLVEASGQQILDALEFSASSYPDEFGGFLQVSGITYELDGTIPSPIAVDEYGSFAGVNGERRVSNVTVGGEPIDPAKTYTLASHNYMLKNGGDGYTMFEECNILKDELYIDNEVLIKYITENLNGSVGSEYADLNGEGRFTIKTAQTDEAQSDSVSKTPLTGNAPVSVSIITLISAAALMLASRTRK